MPRRLFHVMGGAAVMVVRLATAATVGAATAGPAAPYLSISVRDAVDDAIEPGMPVRVMVRVEAPDDATEPLLLAPGSGTWADAIAVELVVAGATTPDVRATPIGRPDTPSAKLTEKTVAVGLWRFSAADTKGLRPGEYLVCSRLAIANGAGWTGEVTADEVPLTVVAPSEEPGHVSMRTLALARDTLVDGRNEAAAEIVDGLLQKQPDNVGAWILRSVVGERAGNVLAAMTCIQQAQLHYAALQFDGPNVEIETTQGRLLAALFAPSAAPLPSPESLPAWSWPPEELLQRDSGRAAQPPAGSPPASPSAKAAPPAKAAPSPAGSPPAPAGPAPSPPAALPVPGKSATASQASAGLSGPVALASSAPPPGAVVPCDQVSEDAILKDPHGQWARVATASTQYRPEDYSAKQATGAPDVPTYSDNKHAWSPSSSERQKEWLEVTFAKVVHATEVRVRQSFNPGTIVKVEAFAPDGSGHVLWEGRDPNAYPKNQIAWFAVRFPKTEFSVQRVRITLDTPAAKGWKQIDAVQLVGE